MKKDWFHRYRYWIITGILLVAAGMLISGFRGSSFSRFILNFFNDWSIALSAGAAVILAIAAFRSIREGRRIREVEKELDSKRRRLKEVQDWINDVITVKSECATRVMGDTLERARIGAEVRVILSKKEYIEMEAQRLDSESAEEIKLVNKIGRMSFILEHQNVAQIGDRENQQELENETTEALTVISKLKTILKL